jgi:large subunit ribosomal protein L3
MSHYHKPRAGSKAYSPRKRAKKVTPSITNYPDVADTVLIGFAAYKVGMTQVFVKNLDKHSPTRDLDLQIPVTILDAPPLVVFGIRAYIRAYKGLETLTDVLAEKLDRDLAKALSIPKDANNDPQMKKVEENLDNIVKFTVLVHTQPRKAGLPKKKPDIIELAIGGEDPKSQWEYCKGLLGKEIGIKDVFRENIFVDAVAVTKGKGRQGPVTRWGIKMQKRKHMRGGHMRLPGCIGPWTPAATKWYAPQAGQMGYQKRTEFNKFLIKIGEKGDEINPKGGFVRYGLVEGEYVMLKGSIPGPKKRLIGIRPALRPPERMPQYALESI